MTLKKKKKNNNFMSKLKNMNKIFFVWAALCAVFVFFIGYLSWFFPLSGDEILYPHELSFLEHLKRFIFTPYMSLRIGCFFSLFFINFGIWIYKILNPFVQLTLIFSAFYFIYMRFPRFDSLKDLPSFILLLVLGTFFIAAPSDVLIWVGGSTNYSWVFIAFIWFIIYLRKLEEGKIFTNKYFTFFCFFWGLFLGLMNENNSPMVLCLMMAFFVYARFKNIKIKSDFISLFIGLAIGVYILFAFSGNDVRLQLVYFGTPVHHTLFQKLYIHLHRMNSFSAANLCLIYLLPLLLFLFALDKRKVIFKEKTFYLSLLCWAVAFGLSIVLCEAPLLAIRAFYSASWFCIFSVFFMLLEMEKLYKVKLIKYLSFIFLLAFLYIAPFFIIGANTTYHLVTDRQIMIDKAKENGRKKIFLPLCIYQDDKLPENWQIIYYDPLQENKRWSDIEGIEIKNLQGDNVRFI